MGVYKYNACNYGASNFIATHIKEGCGIRSIARLLKISAVTVVLRIRKIANSIKIPPMLQGGIYEVDELRTYVKNKSQECWIMYALDRHTKQVVALNVGRRTKMNLQFVTDTLLLAKCRKIYTDGLNIYRYLIPAAPSQEGNYI